MRKNFKAFTLVEMLIVMGIIIILMAVGIASGRYAIRRANAIEHQNAAEQIYQALQSYYADNRQYPDVPGTTPVETLITTTLDEYIDDFDGGSQATYYYDVDGTNQVVLVCVTMGGLLDESELGAYCTGNGINAEAGTLDVDVTQKELAYDATAGTEYSDVIAAMQAGGSSAWDPASPW